MQLVKVTSVRATDKPTAFMCMCTVNHGTDDNPEIEENMYHAYDPDDIYASAFSKSVGLWLADNEGKYTIEEI